MGPRYITQFSMVDVIRRKCIAPCKVSRSLLTDADNVFFKEISQKFFQFSFASTQ
jgi:hypothetical protein